MYESLPEGARVKENSAFALELAWKNLGVRLESNPRMRTTAEEGGYRWYGEALSLLSENEVTHIVRALIEEADGHLNARSMTSWQSDNSQTA
jgi:hypothetical protein